MKPALPVPALLYIVDQQPGSEIEPLLSIAECALEGGVNWIHLRAPHILPELCLDTAHILRRLTRSTGALFSVNRHLSVALQSGADGIHLPEDEGIDGMKRLSKIRNGLIGRSVHRVESALRAVQEGCDYLMVGTLFETGSHPGKVPEGLGLLRAIRLQTDVPLIGIGGITPERARECMQAGVSGVAAISAFTQSRDPAETARHFMESLRSGQTCASAPT
jgi:thiamine-phosphate diphosphorylase